MAKPPCNKCGKTTAQLQAEARKRAALHVKPTRVRYLGKGHGLVLKGKATGITYRYGEHDEFDVSHKDLPAMLAMFKKRHPLFEIVGDDGETIATPDVEPQVVSPEKDKGSANQSSIELIGDPEDLSSDDADADGEEPLSIDDEDTEEDEDDSTISDEDDEYDPLADLENIEVDSAEYDADEDKSPKTVSPRKSTKKKAAKKAAKKTAGS